MTVRPGTRSLAALWLALCLPAAATLAGCSTASVAENLPADLGLPAGTPARPAGTPQYPAVHDMPPPRTSETLNEDEVAKLQQDLITARDNQEGRPQAAKKKPGKAAAKPAANSPTFSPASAASEPAGVRRNP